MPLIIIITITIIIILIIVITVNVADFIFDGYIIATAADGSWWLYSRRYTYPHRHARVTK